MDKRDEHRESDSRETDFRRVAARVAIGLLLLGVLAALVALAFLVSVPVMLVTAGCLLLLAAAGFTIRRAGRRVDRILDEELDQ